MPRKAKNPLQLQEEILEEEIRKVQLTLKTAHANFENEVDPDLIDCFIYEVNAAQQRYKFLMRQAKILHDAKLEAAALRKEKGRKKFPRLLNMT